MMTNGYNGAGKRFPAPHFEQGQDKAKSGMLFAIM